MSPRSAGLSVVGPERRALRSSDRTRVVRFDASGAATGSVSIEGGTMASDSARIRDMTRFVPPYGVFLHQTIQRRTIHVRQPRCLGHVAVRPRYETREVLALEVRDE